MPGSNHRKTEKELPNVLAPCQFTRWNSLEEHAFPPVIITLLHHVLYYVLGRYCASKPPKNKLSLGIDAKGRPVRHMCQPTGDRCSRWMGPSFVFSPSFFCASMAWQAGEVVSRAPAEDE